MIPMHNIPALESRSVQSRETRFNFRFSDTTQGNSVNPQMSAKAYQMKDDKGVAMVTHVAVAWHGVPNGATSRTDRADTALTREVFVYPSCS